MTDHPIVVFLFMAMCALATVFYSWHLFRRALEKDGLGRLPRRFSSSFLFSILNIFVFFAIIAIATVLRAFPEIMNALPESLSEKFANNLSWLRVA